MLAVYVSEPGSNPVKFISFSSTLQAYGKLDVFNHLRGKMQVILSEQCLPDLVIPSTWP